MAEQKDDQSQAGGRSAPSKKTAQQAGASAASEGGAAAGAEGRADVGTVTRRKQQYLIGIRPLPGFAPVSSDSILEKLKVMDEVEIVRRLHARGFQALAADSMPMAGMQDIIVVRMDEQRGEALRQSAPPYLVVEV